jgi:hypothetical protein
MADELIHEMIENTNENTVIKENGFEVGVEKYKVKVTGEQDPGEGVANIKESYEDSQFKSPDNLNRKETYWKLRRTQNNETKKSDPGNKSVISYEETEKVLVESSAGIIEYINGVSEGIKNLITPSDPSNIYNTDESTGITTVQSGETTIAYKKNPLDLHCFNQTIKGEYLDSVEIKRDVINGDFEMDENGLDYKRDENGNLIPKKSHIEATSIIDYTNKCIDALFMYISNSNKNLLSLIGFPEDVEKKITVTTPDGKTLVAPANSLGDDAIIFKNDEYKDENLQPHQIADKTLFGYVKKADKELFARASANSDGDAIGDLMWTSQA